MSLDLEGIYAQQINLYEELDIKIESSPQDVPLTLIKKQYKKMALMYHPDKQPDSSSAIHKFHMLSLATHILTDEYSRAAYDKWLERRIGNDEQRNELINKLNERESRAQKKDRTHFAKDLTHIQEYGSTLRKMKHFKIPYGDWKTLNLSQTTQKSSPEPHKFYDSSTLRIEVRNVESSGDLADKHILMEFLRQIFEVESLHDLYYSSRNDFANSESIVSYVVFETPRESQLIFKRWTANPDLSSWGPILDVSPWIPIKYYKNFTKQVDLAPEIAALVNNNTVIID